MEKIRGEQDGGESSRARCTESTEWEVGGRTTSHKLKSSAVSNENANITLTVQALQFDPQEKAGGGTR